MRAGPDEEVLFRGHPSWLSMKAFVVRGLVLCLVIGIVAGIASTVADGRAQSSWVVAATLAAFALRFARGQRRRMRVTYLVTSRRVSLETSRWLRRRVHQAELGHVAAVSCRQSLLERACGIGTIRFDTAAELGFDLCFHGVDDPAWLVGTVDRALDRRPQGWDLRPPWPPAEEWDAPAVYR